MNASLDEMLQQLARRSQDADFAELEPRTLRRIARMRRMRAHEAWLMPARAGAVVLALSLGAALGVSQAREAASPPEAAAFDLARAYAPSTLLDHP